jgi:5-methylcytosine-specific restriction endonuclease McrA
MNNSNCVLLNATYEPLDILSTRRGINLLLKGKAVMVQESEEVCRSETQVFVIPRTIALIRYIAGRRAYSAKAKLSQRNLHVRDNFTCQYCGKTSSDLRGREILTRDHVYPRSLGGLDKWKNVVTACSSCNTRKGNTLLRDSGMTLSYTPHIPTRFELLSKTKLKDASYNYLF